MLGLAKPHSNPRPPSVPRPEGHGGLGSSTYCTGSPKRVTEMYLCGRVVLCCAFDVLLLIYGVEHDAEQTKAHFTVFDSVAWPELVLLAGLITSVADCPLVLTIVKDSKHD